MPASSAPNETRLPRAVLRQSAAIAARFAPAAESATPTPADDNAPAPGPAAPPAASAEPAANAPAVDPRENDPNYWKQRFSVTSGILAKERKDRSDERESLRQQITELQSKAPSSTVPDAAIDLSKFYTPEQIDQYGEEQCRVMAKTAMDAARATAQDLIDAAVRPLKEQREREATDRKAEARQAFTDKLAELVPNYQTLDVDPRWNDEHTGWLAQEDENGVQRQALLDIHIRNGDAAKIARMFKAFEATLAPPPVPVPPVAPSGSGAGAHDAAPPAGPAAVGGAPTDAEVKDYYKRSAIGKVKDDERVKFEARLKLRNAAG